MPRLSYGHRCPPPEWPPTGPGLVYLLHFKRRYRHAGHYIGYTLNLDARLRAHRAGYGARLLAVVKAAGIGWTLARVWTGDRTRERQLKRQGGAARLCPVCRKTRDKARPPRAGGGGSC